MPVHKACGVPCRIEQNPAHIRDAVSRSANPAAQKVSVEEYLLRFAGDREMPAVRRDNASDCTHVHRSARRRYHAGMESLRDRLRATLGVDLVELAGAECAADVPLTDALVNRLVAGQVHRRLDLPVSDVRLESGDGDTFEAHVSLRKFPMIPVRIVARIEQQARPDNPVLAIRWSLPSLGPLAALAGGFIANFKDFPPGIRLDGDRLLIDVRELLTSRGLRELLDCLTELEVHSRKGAFLVRVRLRIPPR